MNEPMPKIVTSRLARLEPRQDGQSHPDADLLTAYVERVLPEGEQNGILRHLVDCADCRAVVALAQPENVEPAAPIGATVVPRRASTVWIWRWAALAACAVVAVSLALRHHGNHFPTVAQLTESAQDGAAGSRAQLGGKPSPSVATPAAPDVAALGTTSPPGRRAELPAVDPLAPQGVTGGLIAEKTEYRNDAVGGNRATNESAANQPAAPAAAPAAELKAEVANDGAVRKKEEIVAGVNSAAGQAALDATTASAPAQLAKAKLSVAARDKQPATDAAPTPVAPTERGAFRASSAQIANTAGFGGALQASTWQVTDAGNLQRSIDGGKSWESVSVTATARLRVVAVSGFHIWVGANGGLLLHSADSGSHFTPVSLSQGGTTLTGDIVVLIFSDALHGRLETSAHEVWSTADGGKNWLAASPSR